jgi:MGT family glycosyltransferase
VVASPAQVEIPPGVDNILVRERVPQLALLRHLDAVVSHGGHNTVCETLAEGIPLVLAPIRDDQPIVSDQVVRAGAGVRVRFGRVRPDELLAAVRTVLDDPSYRRAAGVIRQSFLDAGGAVAAADALEALLGDRRRPRHQPADPVKEPA